MSEGNFIVLLRKITEWEWYTDVPTKTLFLHLLLTANYKPKQWQGLTIKRGELITSVSSLAEQTGLTVKQIRRALNNLELTKEIECVRTNKYTLVKVHNYGKYQDYEKATGQTKGNQKANKGQTKGNNITNKQRNKETRYIYTSDAPVCEERIAIWEFAPDVLMTDSQACKLIEWCSPEELEQYVSNLQDYIEEGHKVHNCYETICRWKERDSTTRRRVEK